MRSARSVVMTATLSERRHDAKLPATAGRLPHHSLGPGTSGSCGSEFGGWGWG